jgi:hypothetical protein
VSVGTCLDCGGHAELYLLRDAVWEESGGGKGRLCVPCCEARLGRRLHMDDFRWSYTAGIYPLNGWLPSPALWEALGRGL